MKAQKAVTNRKSEWSFFLCDEFRDFWTDHESQTIEFLVSPTVYELDIHETNNGEARVARTPSDTVHEFASLYALLTDHDEIRRELNASGTNLT